MNPTSFIFNDSEGMTLFTRRWEPEASAIRGVILIIHGISEHSGRYEAVAEALTDSGYMVYAHDQRGHGQTSLGMEKLGYAGKDGWNLLVRDVFELIEVIKKENPGSPVFILGHSMGSFILRSYMHRYGNLQGIKGYILSGTGGSTTSKLYAARFLCSIIIKKNGERYKSKLIQQLTFNGYNARCPEKRTEYDWLSRDAEVVDKYIQDDLCGQICSASFYKEFFRGIIEVQQDGAIEKIPKDIPVLMLSGHMDPVGQYGKIIELLLDKFKAVGIKDITYKLYPGGRHEMLNEVNRDEVIQDIIDWLDLKNQNIIKKE